MTDPPDSDPDATDDQWRCPACEQLSYPHAEMGARGSWHITCPHCGDTQHVPSPERFFDHR